MYIFMNQETVSVDVIAVPEIYYARPQ